MIGWNRRTLMMGAAVVASAGMVAAQQVGVTRVVISAPMVVLSNGAATEPAKDSGNGVATSAPGGALGGAAGSATKPAIAGPTVEGSLTEWVIFVGNPYSTDLNAKELANDTLPAFVNELRDAPAASTGSGGGDGVTAGAPLPIGVIRFVPERNLDKATTIDVALGYKAGRALGSWPAAKVRASGLLWQDLAVADKTDAAPLIMPEGAWIAPLRGGGGGTLLKSGTTTESFLLYDLELTYPVGLQMTPVEGDEKYAVVQPMDAVMHDLTFYKQDGAGHWRTATVESLGKTAGSVMHPVEKPKPAEPVAVNGVRRVIVRPAGTMPAAAATQAVATTGPATQPKGTEVELASVSDTDATVLGKWREKLAEAGVTAGDQEVALKILGKYALDKKRLTAVYRMDPAELDKILPLEVVPQPKKVSRIALVVMTGIDPAIETELDGEIAKLGSADWKEREVAMEVIAKMGPMAKNRLERATRDKDMEIVYRAEKLLEMLSPVGADPQ